MKRFAIMFVLLTACGAAWSGVVIEMEADGGTDTVYTDGQRLRMDSPGGRGGGPSSMIFKGDTLLVCENAKKRCYSVTREDVAELGSQMSGMMEQMQAELAKLPPEQRAMMEKMMKDRMPAGMGQEPPPTRIDKGGSERVGEYTCAVHTKYSGEEKVWEVCAGKTNAAFDEAMTAFRAMAAFSEELRASLAQGPLGNMLQTPFSDMEQVGGPPIRMRVYSRGQLVSESTLKSIERREVDSGLFETPKGFKTKSMADELKRGR